MADAEVSADFLRVLQPCTFDDAFYDACYSGDLVTASLLMQVGDKFYQPTIGHHCLGLVMCTDQIKFVQLTTYTADTNPVPPSDTVEQKDEDTQPDVWELSVDPEVEPRRLSSESEAYEAIARHYSEQPNPTPEQIRQDLVSLWVAFRYWADFDDVYLPSRMDLPVVSQTYSGDSWCARVLTSPTQARSHAAELFDTIVAPYLNLLENVHSFGDAPTDIYFLLFASFARHVLSSVVGVRASFDDARPILRRAISKNCVDFDSVLQNHLYNDQTDSISDFVYN